MWAVKSSVRSLADMRPRLPMWEKCFPQILICILMKQSILMPSPRTDIHPVFPEGVLEEIRDDAVRIFKAVDGYGLSRVDFFLEKDTNEVIFNEINTLPGFTGISMYPVLWEDKGVDKGSLIDALIQQAFERYGA